MANFFSAKEKPTGKFCLIYRMILAIAILLAVGFCFYYVTQYKDDGTYEKGVELVQDMMWDMKHAWKEMHNA